jgi:transposase-like protein
LAHAATDSTGDAGGITFKKADGRGWEVDETFIGGLARNMHASKRKHLGTGGAGKVAVMGLLERHGGEVRTKVIASTKREELQREVYKHVEQDSHVYTDAYVSYNGLNSDYFHMVINHAEEYVNGNIHTNGIENFWSLLKRTIKGTYVSIEPFHLFRYLDEQSFRFNKRKLTDSERFLIVSSQIMGRRLTYSELTGKDARQA